MNQTRRHVAVFGRFTNIAGNIGLTASLLKTSEYRPPITSYSNKQWPLPFLLPVIRYEIDVEKLAEATVQVLIRGLLTDMKEASVEGFPIGRIESDEVLG